MTDPLRIELNEDYTDEERSDFLNELYNSELSITKFEEEFLESNLDRTTFTSKQRLIIDAMMLRYDL